MDDFNRKHPELGPDETFVCNGTPAVFEQITWKTKRLGDKAYAEDGEIIPPETYPEQTLRPVFMRQQEWDAYQLYLSSLGL